MAGKISEFDNKTLIQNLGWRVWEEDQRTNPTPVNPNAFVYGFLQGYDQAIDIAIEAIQADSTLVRDIQLVGKLKKLKSK